MTSTMVDNRARVPCRFFARGKCRSGLSCPFSHDETDPTATSSAQDVRPRRKLEKPERNTDMGDFWRTMAGASVRFEDGGRVAEVCLPEDVSAVQLSGLPPEATSAASVQAFLARLGFSVAASDVRLLPPGAGSGSGSGSGSGAAVIRSEDPAFAGRLCAHLVKLAETGGCRWGSSEVKALRVAVPMPTDHTAGGFDCRKVHVSWQKPVRTAWLNFGSSDAATRVSRDFAAGVYKVLGQQVVAEGPERPSTPPVVAHGGDDGFRHQDTSAVWTVQLNDVPVAADDRAVISGDITRPEDQPSHVELSPPTYVAQDGDEGGDGDGDGDGDEEYCTAVVCSLLAQSGSMEYWETTLETTTKHIKATARFYDEADARAAAAQLDGSPLPFHADGRLTVRLVYSVKFKVGSSIYDALAPRIDTLSGGVWREAPSHVRFFAYPSPSQQQNYRILKLEGESDKAVAAAKGELDRILGGVVARDDEDRPLWDASLGRNDSSLWLEARRVGRETAGLVLVRSKARSQLLLFGSQPKCDEAQRRLQALCAKSDQASGSLLQDLHIAIDLVERQPEASKKELPAAKTVTEAADCCVCWTEEAVPIQTSCGHIYCQECFDNGCASPSAGKDDFALLCHDQRCGRRLALADLQEHLSSAALEDVLVRSFAAFVQRHPDQLRFCPTPDCGHVYRVLALSLSSPAPSSSTHTCPNCLQATCMACAQPHDGAMTCADYSDLRSGGVAAFERLKKELGVKDCPRCKTPIEKVEGCNHMTCLACNAHICWVCLKTFSDGSLVYGHLEDMHGGHVDFA